LPIRAPVSPVVIPADKAGSIMILESYLGSILILYSEDIETRRGNTAEQFMPKLKLAK
jgi:hypothetical protein